MKIPYKISSKKADKRAKNGDFWCYCKSLFIK